MARNCRVSSSPSILLVVTTFLAMVATGRSKVLVTSIDGSGSEPWLKNERFYKDPDSPKTKIPGEHLTDYYHAKMETYRREKKTPNADEAKRLEEMRSAMMHCYLAKFFPEKEEWIAKFDSDEYKRSCTPDKLAKYFTENKEEWIAKMKADEQQYREELANYVPPEGYDETGNPIPDPRIAQKSGGRPVTKEETNRTMRSIAAITGVKITEENPRIEISQIPYMNSKRGGVDNDIWDSFFEWTGIDEYLEQDRTSLDNNTKLKYEWFENHLYDGHRIILESLLKDNWEQKILDFKKIPDTAEWSLQSVEGTLMPILQDSNKVYLLAPTLAECTSRLRKFIMPTPYKDRPEKAKPGYYMNYDVWFEKGFYGGTYVLGVDDTVLLFYIDGDDDDSDDLIRNRWQCSKEQWESMWLKAFAATSIELDDKIETTLSIV